RASACGLVLTCASSLGSRCRCVRPGRLAARPPGHRLGRLRARERPSSAGSRQAFMRVVADSHAIVWYVQGSPRLSERASAALSEAEASDGIVVSVATLVDLWYVTQTTQGVTADDLVKLKSK